MKIAVLTANLGGFDTDVANVGQSVEHTFHRFTDADFPPITGLSSRLQYRIPKMFGWQMKPGHDVYVWFDGSFSMQHSDSVKWLLDELGDKDIALFRHPWRNNIKAEVEHIEDHLQKGKPYITARYKNGLHKEQYDFIRKDKDYFDNVLYTSTAFVYRNSPRVQDFFYIWWFLQSRYFTCDQVSQPYAVWKTDLRVQIIEENQYKIPYLSLTSKHK